MGLSKTVIVLTILTVFIGLKVRKSFKIPPLPKLEETWWGAGDPWREDKSIRPFEVKVSAEDLKDLKYRLDHARPFTPPLEGIQQQYGMNTNLLKEIVEFWRTQYDWTKREKLFNQFPQYKTSVQGLNIHFVHVKPEVPQNINVYPLLILHGWPGSVREFFEIIPFLTTPQPGRDFVFEIIAPHIPGYGFSDAAVRPGLGAPQIALVFKNFMKRLGFETFYMQGGDFGAIILDNLAILYPEVVLGYHANLCTVYTPLSYIKTLLGALYPTLFTRADHVERVYPLSETFSGRLRETGYFHIQATKPDTIGVALKDSPVGLAAYILEKFTTATNYTFQLREDGGLKEVYDYNDLLDNIMVYWITGSMPTAMRLYAETFNKKYFELGITRNPITTPHACARFRNDFYASDGILNEKYQNLLHLADYHGGHFAAFQLPKVLADDVFEAVEKFRLHNLQTKRNKEL